MPDAPLVTLAQAAEMLVGTGISFCTIKRHRDDGRFQKVKVGRAGNNGAITYYYNFEDIKRVAEELRAFRDSKMPDGWIDAREASNALNMNHSAVLYLAKKGMYQAKKIDYGTVSKKWIFRRDLVEADIIPTRAAPKLAEGTEQNYLICARHEWCLHARREMFARAGRELNLKKALARSRKAV